MRGKEGTRDRGREMRWNTRGKEGTRDRGREMRWNTDE